MHNPHCARWPWTMTVSGPAAFGNTLWTTKTRVNGALCAYISSGPTSDALISAFPFLVGLSWRQAWNNLHSSLRKWHQNLLDVYIHLDFIGLLACLYEAGVRFLQR